MKYLLPLTGILILLKLTVPGFLLPWWAVLTPGIIVVVAGTTFWYLFFSGELFSTKNLYRFRIEWKWADEDETMWIPFEQKGKPVICKYSTEAERLIRNKLAPNHVGMEFRYQTLGSGGKNFGPATNVGVE